MKHPNGGFRADRPVLVAVDFSPESESAVLLACSLVASSGAPIVVLHVAHEPGERPGFYRRNGKQGQILPIEDLARRELEDFMKDVKKENPEVSALRNAEKMVVSGLPATRIVEVAESIGAQLIVMGSNGRSTLGKLVSGSVSDDVVRKSSIPATVVHAHAQDGVQNHFFPDNFFSSRSATPVASG